MRLILIVATLLLVEIFAAFESGMIFVALPKIAAEYKDVAGAGWLITGFVLAQAATAAIGGRMGDLFGRRRVLIILMALCTLGSAISATSSSLGMILLGRVIQGCSGAILPICYGIMKEAGPRERLPFLIGCLTGGYAVGSAFGYILGGVFVDMGGWHAIFICTVVFGLVLLLPIRLIVPKGLRQPRSLR